MKKLATLCLLLSTVGIAANAQVRWNNAPHTGIVYQITNKEAQKLLTASWTDTIISGMLHTQVDTFDLRKGWLNRPSKGHFILASIVGNKVHCEYTSVFPYQVFLLKEYDALALQVLDLEGNVRTDARVKFKVRKIPIDPDSKTYRIANSFVYGSNKVVTVELDGFRSVFNIERHDVPNWDYSWNEDEGPSFYSYMITDKNKYKPNEKIRFKSYVLSNNRSPLHRSLALWLMGPNKTFQVATVSPHRPGSFTGEFQLHDSLKLVLDRSYSLQLRDKSGRIVATSHFKFEDYELNGNRVELRLTKDKQYHPDRNDLSITATDVNDLMLKDGRATIAVKTRHIRETFQPIAVLKDTLFFKEIDLDPAEPTIISIPSELFQKTNTSYDVVVTVLNSQNQRVEKTTFADHYYSQYELRARLVNDTIIYEMLDNGHVVSNAPAKLAHHGELNPKNVVLPYKEKLNPAVTSVNLQVKEMSRTIFMREALPRLELKGGIEKDSLKIQLANPQKIETTWYIYQGNEVIRKGSGRELEFDTVISDRTRTFFAEVLYSFGGEEYVKQKAYEFRKGLLNVALEIPDRAYPGQTVDALIKVSNEAGDEVSGVDVTALAVTSKLQYNLPDLPYYGNVSSGRPMRATFTKSDLNKRTATMKLNYKRWEQVLRLDTMKYFQFTYPRPGMFVSEIGVNGRAQFAPYVMRDGLAVNVYVIEVDQVPVYFSWADQPNQYSFYAPDKKCKITLRLHDRVLVFDSLRFNHGKKTILSVDLDRLPPNVKTIKIPLPKKKYRRERVHPSFTPTEIDRYQQYISAFKNTSPNSFLESDTQFTPLFNDLNHHRGSIIAGPIRPGMHTFTGTARGTTTSYRHSGGYTYAFEDNIVYKLDAKDLVPKHLMDISFDPMTKLNDQVMTKDEFTKSHYIDDNRWHTRVIDVIDRRMRFRALLPEEAAASGVASFVFEDPVTRKVVSPCQLKYSVESQVFEIPGGRQSAIVIYNNGTYLKKDSIDLQPYSHVLIDLNKAILHPADTLSSRWLRVAGTNCYKSRVEPRINVIRDRTAIGGNVRGKVFSAEDNSLLPGVNVVIKGINEGTVTNEDGEFGLNVDDTSVTVVFSFIGLVTQEVEVGIGSDITVLMVADVMQLSEVVVTGYGTQSRKELAGALSGRVAGVQADVSDESEEAKQEAEDDIQQREAEARIYRDLLNLKSIRSQFSDVGFWEPKLFTDRHGEAKFAVTYPDDITQWDATVYAMNRQLQTGTARKNIKSYKPIMAELAVPNFLTRGDSSVFIGKITNYSDDQRINGKTRWSGIGADQEKMVAFNDLLVDRLPVNAASVDSITTSYLFTGDDGYIDGEQRTVPVIEQGIVRAEGSLSILDTGDAQQIKATTGKNVVELLADPIDLYQAEARYLVDYRYMCNEQLASKLLGMIAYRSIMQYEGKRFKYDKDIDRIIARLIRNQNDEYLWSWWDVSSNTSYWMSAHILRALKAAADAGYRVNLDLENVKRKAEYKFDIKKEYWAGSIDLVNALALWGVKLNYKEYVQRLDTVVWKNENVKYRNGYKESWLKERLLLLEVRQLMDVSFKC